MGDGVSELRIYHGPGYRVYYVQRGSVLIILLCGGDKRGQAKDIALALKLAKEVRYDHREPTIRSGRLPGQS